MLYFLQMRAVGIVAEDLGYKTIGFDQVTPE